ncbi:hypothetical protein WN55_07131 [Dufourea novaeangliae]|uniref:Uncharacterized protein n=1 Tax=Dufourea novaeangliae TaxID=178035 RepID=A0A154P285_DUFNO|nr:hypothetical protein WN55_07131 [Dufourea novaeangliae]
MVLRFWVTVNGAPGEILRLYGPSSWLLFLMLHQLFRDVRLRKVFTVGLLFEGLDFDQDAMLEKIVTDKQKIVLRRSGPARPAHQFPETLLARRLTGRLGNESNSVNETAESSRLQAPPKLRSFFVSAFIEGQTNVWDNLIKMAVGTRGMRDIANAVYRDPRILRTSISLKGVVLATTENCVASSPGYTTPSGGWQRCRRDSTVSLAGKPTLFEAPRSFCYPGNRPILAEKLAPDLRDVGPDRIYVFVGELSA